jgi:fructose-1,6-bisphosphatase/inositol monophosphatase family enzyme
MDTRDILDLMKAVADEYIRPRFRSLAQDQIFEKGRGDYVTVADREAEAALAAALRAAFPGAFIIGEEATAADPGLLDGLAARDHVFVVDPVDGTRNFIQSKPVYAVMIGELRQGVATRGWVWQPEAGVAYVAERGAGVERNGVRLQPVSRRDGYRGATTITRVLGRVSSALAEPVQKSNYCAGADYPMILDGDIDFVVYKPPKPWDHVPGTLMLRELGGVARMLDGRDYQADVTTGDLVAAAHEAAYEAALTVTY